jgi:hypothetical protein
MGECVVVTGRAGNQPSWHCETHGVWFRSEACPCAALREENERLKAKADDAWAHNREMYLQSRIAHEQRDQARAEVAKLREAIQTHAECVTVCDRCGHETPNDTDDVRAALKGTK